LPRISSLKATASILIAEDERELPNLAILRKLNGTQTKLLGSIKAGGHAITTAAEEAAKSIQAIRTEWIPKKEAAEELYQKTLRELRADGHDGNAFVKIKDQVERLKPKEIGLDTRRETLSDLKKTRRQLLAKWDDLKAQDFRELQKAARKVTKRLNGRVRVDVRRSSSLGDVETTLRKHCPGNISQALERLRGTGDRQPDGLRCGRKWGHCDPGGILRIFAGQRGKGGARWIRSSARN
jgi:hypothetical protein